MKKVLVNYGGIILFYVILVLGVLFINTNNSSKYSQKSSFNTSCVYCK